MRYRSDALPGPPYTYCPVLLSDAVRWRRRRATPPHLAPAARAANHADPSDARVGPLPRHRTHPTGNHLHTEHGRAGGNPGGDLHCRVRHCSTPTTRGVLYCTSYSADGAHYMTLPNARSLGSPRSGFSLCLRSFFLALYQQKLRCPRARWRLHSLLATALVCKRRLRKALISTFRLLMA